MKTPIMVLLTNDSSVEECVAQVLLETGGLSHLAHSASEALDLVDTIDFDLAVVDCEHGPHGLTLVGAMNSRHANLPLIVVTQPEQKHIEALAYANGASACISKPILATQLAEAIKQCRQSHPQLTNVT